MPTKEAQKKDAPVLSVPAQILALQADIEQRDRQLDILQHRVTQLGSYEQEVRGLREGQEKLQSDLEAAVLARDQAVRETSLTRAEMLSRSEATGSAKKALDHAEKVVDHLRGVIG